MPALLRQTPGFQPQARAVFGIPADQQRIFACFFPRFGKAGRDKLNQHTVKQATHDVRGVLIETDALAHGDKNVVDQVARDVFTAQRADFSPQFGGMCKTKRRHHFFLQRQSHQFKNRVNEAL